MVLSDAIAAVESERRVGRRPIGMRLLASSSVGADLYKLRVDVADELPLQSEGSTIRCGDWSSRLLEVDANRHELFVDAETAPPREGELLLWPFDFLEGVVGVLQAPEHSTRLEARLQLAAGRRGPDELPESAFGRLWGHSWTQLWGPPGTGKTHTLAGSIPRVVAASGERILVVSTTNRATDELAQRLARDLTVGDAVRVGSGASVANLGDAAWLLDGVELPMRRHIDELQALLDKAVAPERRAEVMQKLHDARGKLRDAGKTAFLSDTKVVMTTAYKAVEVLAHLTRDGGFDAPFDTVVVDEAGLLPRVAVAAMSLLAARRTILAGDPKQLSPVARGTLYGETAEWVAKSGLAHLDIETMPSCAVVLGTQHRMAPRIRAVVSAYSYASRLKDAGVVVDRAAPTGVSQLVGDGGERAIWYVLDEHPGGKSVTASRGPGNRSFVREVTLNVLERLFQASPDLRQTHGLFLCPFVAQAEQVRVWLRDQAPAWRAMTIHRAQGLEADVVVFDTVQATRGGWGAGEWQRLINVGMSRARHVLLVLASRAEAEVNAIRPVFHSEPERALRPMVLRAGKLIDVDRGVADAAPVDTGPRRGLAEWIRDQRDGRPLLTADQERLFNHDILDGGARLVRGVAGSGKSLILAHWAARLLHGTHGQVGFVYANQALRPLLERLVRIRWRALAGSEPMPDDRLTFVHLLDVLKQLGGNAANPFDYSAMAQSILAGGKNPRPLWNALVVDEAQDVGPNAMRLLTTLVHAGPDGRSRNVLVAYDNAQKLFGTIPINWATDVGVSMQGRSTVLRESFRSTRQILEIAQTVLLGGAPHVREDDEWKELERDGLVSVDGSSGRVSVAHCAHEGPPVTFRSFPSRAAELHWLAAEIRQLLDDGLPLRDVAVAATSTAANSARQHLPHLLGLACSDNPSDLSSLRVVTPHSLKGHEADVVFVFGVEAMIPRANVDAGVRAIYVAMTRARSVLYVSGSPPGIRDEARVAKAALLESLAELCPVACPSPPPGPLEHR